MVLALIFLNLAGGESVEDLERLEHDAGFQREFRKAVLSVSDPDWQPLYRSIDGVPSKTDQEWAEVCFVPSWAGNRRNRAEYRFIALREPFGQLDIGDADQLPFPAEEFDKKGCIKLF